MRTALVIWACLLLLNAAARVVAQAVLSYPRMVRTSRGVDAFIALFNASLAVFLLWLALGAEA
jgi:hypothetical protein